MCSYAGFCYPHLNPFIYFYFFKALQTSWVSRSEFSHNGTIGWWSLHGCTWCPEKQHEQKQHGIYIFKSWSYIISNLITVTANNLSVCTTRQRLWLIVCPVCWPLVGGSQRCLKDRLRSGHKHPSTNKQAELDRLNQLNRPLWRCAATTNLKTLPVICLYTCSTWSDSRTTLFSITALDF